MKKRTRARELALQFLYQLDLRGEELLPEAREFIRGEEKDVEAGKFAQRLVEGTFEHRTEIDEMIQEVAQNWSISRMAVVDRNVLRLATFELLHCNDIPPKVAINEAIELGKRYSTSNSGAFINGILDKIMNRTKVSGDTNGASGGSESSGPSRGGEANGPSRGSESNGTDHNAAPSANASSTSEPKEPAASEPGSGA